MRRTRRHQLSHSLRQLQSASASQLSESMRQTHARPGDVRQEKMTHVIYCRYKVTRKEKIASGATVSDCSRLLSLSDLYAQHRQHTHTHN